MKDPYNLTSDDIRSWAYDAKSYEPIQDWDLMISPELHSELCIELAGDEACPKWDYFMSILYLMVGNTFRSKNASNSKRYAEQIIKSVSHLQNSRFRLLCERYRKLCDLPSSFSYDDWCAGGWVAKDKKVAEQGAASDR